MAHSNKYYMQTVARNPFDVRVNVAMYNDLQRVERFRGIKVSRLAQVYIEECLTYISENEGLLGGILHFNTKYEVKPFQAGRARFRLSINAVADKEAIQARLNREETEVFRACIAYRLGIDIAELDNIKNQA